MPMIDEDDGDKREDDGLIGYSDPYTRSSFRLPLTSQPSCAEPQLSPSPRRWQKVRQEAAMVKHTLTPEKLEGLSVAELRAVESLGVISGWTLEQLLARKRAMQGKSRASSPANGRPVPLMGRRSASGGGAPACAARSLANTTPQSRAMASPTPAVGGLRPADVKIQFSL